MAVGHTTQQRQLAGLKKLSWKNNEIVIHRLLFGN
jgi:hypothetical protein